MARSEFNYLLGSINSLSPERMWQLRRELDNRLIPSSPADRQAGEQQANVQLQQELLDAGIIGEIRQPITDSAPYQNRRAVPIQGEPISETIIRERR